VPNQAAAEAMARKWEAGILRRAVGNPRGGPKDIRGLIRTGGYERVKLTEETRTKAVYGSVLKP